MLSGRRGVATNSRAVLTTLMNWSDIDVESVALRVEQRRRQAEGLVAERELEVEHVAVPDRSDHGRHAVPDGEREIDPELQAVVLHGLAEADVAAPLARGARREPRIADGVEG